MNWSLYAPTPKMMAVLYAGGLAVVLILLADWLVIDEVRPAVAGLFVLLLAEVGGWLTGDASSPVRDE